MKKQTQTAIAKDIKSATNASAKHATIAETAAERALHHADTAREYTAHTHKHLTTTEQYTLAAASHAEDALTYAHTARTCLILTLILNAITLAAYCALR